MNHGLRESRMRAAYSLGYNATFATQSCQAPLKQLGTAAAPQRPATASMKLLGCILVTAIGYVALSFANINL
ncbi:hypothetical protein FALB51S_04108 [Frigidibacter albus]|uniref:Uncharacterized protein n=1 Tax=Frigidibacter mobilis TaxID=1335048 RepID=A0A159Z5J9_9RHOB|nr:hypothetical protein AKL17_3305 [Frigidibacter mobilis]